MLEKARIPKDAAHVQLNSMYAAKKHNNGRRAATPAGACNFSRTSLLAAEDACCSPNTTAGGRKLQGLHAPSISADAAGLLLRRC